MISASGRDFRSTFDNEYVSSCGIPLMPVVYQVVGFGPLGSSKAERSVIIEGDGVAMSATSKNESKIHAESRLNHPENILMSQPSCVRSQTAWNTEKQYGCIRRCTLYGTFCSLHYGHLCKPWRDAA